MTPNEFRERRRRLALTQEGLARKLGVALTTVARWERGEHTPPAWLDVAMAGVERMLAEERASAGGENGN
jgi:DNA-binding XRE family transcriptional regulator